MPQIDGRRLRLAPLAAAPAGLQLLLRRGRRLELEDCASFGALRGDELEDRDALLRVNHIADCCFGACVNDFGLTKKLRSGEEECIRKCVDKYLLLAAGAGNAFAEHLGNQANAADQQKRKR